MQKLKRIQRKAISKQLDSKWRNTSIKDGIVRIRETPMIRNGIIQNKR